MLNTRMLVTWIIAVLPSIAHGEETRTAQEASGPTASAWPQFRGPFARGVADGKPLPTEWNAPQRKNVKWKTAIPGLGHSSPIVWGDRVFITTSVSGEKDPVLRVGLYGDIAPVNDDTVHTWRVYALDRQTGRIVWEKTAHEGVPRVKRHTKAAHANCTPARDGKHVVTFFGSEGLYCYDFDGDLLWKKDLGVLDAGYWVVPDAQWEFGSSPIIDNGRVFVQCDVQKDSFLAAFDVQTGQEIWRTPRNDVPTWSTPTIHAGSDRTELIVNGYKHMGGYDAATGVELWKMGGGSDIPVPTPFLAGNLIIFTSSHAGPRALYAVQAGATGDISLKDGETSNAHVAWVRIGRGTYMQTPLVYDGILYTCTDSGVFTAYDLKTGEQHARSRISDQGTGFTASGVAGDGKLYYTSEDGDIFVYRAGKDPSRIAVNPMGEVCMATPAIADGNLFIRAQNHVYCIGD